MKKLLLVAALAGLSTAASANPLVNNGYYVQGDVGYSKLNFKFDDEKIKDDDVGYTVAVGKDTGMVRYALDYTNFGKIKGSGTDVTELPNGAVKKEVYWGELKAHSLGLSAIYDFETVSGFTPYVGGRLGVNQVKVEDSEVVTTTAPLSITQETYYDSEKKTKVGFGVLAGAQYAINPQLAVDAGLEYNYLGKFEEAKVHQYGAKVGLRYNF